MSVIVTIPANCLADAVRHLTAFKPDDRHVVLRYQEGGVTWAQVDVTQVTDTRIAVFPLDRNGLRGDTRKQGQAGAYVNDQHSAHVVLSRAYRMGR